MIEWNKDETGCHLLIYNRSIICWYHIPGFFWIRVFGYGFLIKDPKRYPPLFSERLNYTRYYKLFDRKLCFLGKG